MKLFTFIGMLSLASARGFGQGTLEITFDGPPPQPSGTAYGDTSYSESGMLFTPIDPTTGGQFILNGGGTSLFPDDGTPYIQSGGNGLMFGFSDASSFGLASVDLAAYSTVFPDFSVDFVGFLAGGGTITSTFSGTGLNFQTFHFGPEWTGLDSVEVLESPWSLDNLAVAVPEPSEFALAILGSAFFCCRYRRFQRKDLKLRRSENWRF
jgi:hypothetical protein